MGPSLLRRCPPHHLAAQSHGRRITSTSASADVAALSQWQQSVGLHGYAGVPLEAEGGGGGDALLDSVVKIFTVASSPNYLLPWQNKPQRELTGSGFAIAGRRILTNAHVVADQTYVLVRKHGSPKRYRADVAAAAHDCDLALLKICDAAEEGGSGEEVYTGGPSSLEVLEASGEEVAKGREGTHNKGVGSPPQSSPQSSGYPPVYASTQMEPVPSSTVEDEFWEGMVPLELGDIPELQEEVAVVGYPQGGDNISITTGVVSRVEPTQYAHSAAQLLAIQIDAAINPGNSGGPALMMWRKKAEPTPNGALPPGSIPLVDDGPVRGVGAGELSSFRTQDQGQTHRVAGVTFQNLAGAENIGYIIPVPIVRRFLEDAALGNHRFSGFSSLGVACQAMENSQLRAALGMPQDATGVLINTIQPLSAAHGVLEKDDMLVAVDGVPIANDGTIPFRRKERLPFDCLISLKGPKDPTRITILRPTKNDTTSISITLELEATPEPLSKPNGEATSNSGHQCEMKEFDLILKPVPHLVPTHHFDLPPSYLIFAGLVFIPLTQPYLHEYGPDWYNTSPRRLCERAMKGVAKEVGEEVIVLSRVLTDQINSGFERLAELEVIKVNGEKVTNLRGLRDALRSCTDDFLRIDLDDDRVVVVNCEAGKKSSPRILQRYRIPQGVSDDLLPGTGSCDWWETNSL